MNTKKELVEYVYDLHLQNNTEKIDFDRAFKYGIECAIDELEELNKLSLHNVSVCTAPDKILPCRHKCFTICQHNGHCNYKKNKR
jgi:hypothetical protein